MSWIRKKKKFTRPRKAYDKARIEEENKLVEKYGLKKKREIWKADSEIKRIRDLAKKLITSNVNEQEKLFERLRKIGFKIDKIADILALTKEDLLKRRLQSVLIEKGFARPKESRQLIAHRHVLIAGKVLNVPGKIMTLEEEKEIKILRPIKQEEIKNV